MPMEFEQRLERAIERGKRASDARARADAERAMTEAELRRLHTQFRLELSEHIENCLRKLTQHLPGFRVESVASDRGWGAAVSRDDVNLGPDRARGSLFSRFELVIPPLAGSRVLELTAKGTVRNREVLNRNHYEKLADVDVDSFTSLIDRWILEYAERYTASR